MQPLSTAESTTLGWPGLGADGKSACWYTVRREAFVPSGVPEGLLMSINQLISVGLNGYVVALDRDTGELVWSCSELKSGYVSLLLDGDRLIVSTNGYIFCLDPRNGTV
jgi:outer membrane protein assembly factor BamB